MCAAFVTVLSAPAVARADVIGEWNAFAQAQTIPIRPTAHGESRGMAMVEGAVYDAVNALQPDHRPYLLDLQALHAQPFGSQAAAIATAAHDVLVTIVPSGQVGAVHAQRDATLAGIADGPSKTRGDPCRRRCRSGDARLPPERWLPRRLPVRHRVRPAATGVPWVGPSRSRIQGPIRTRGSRTRSRSSSRARRSSGRTGRTRSRVVPMRRTSTR